MFLLFKKPEYRKFDLKPRYWDPVKEEQELRRKRIRFELKSEDNEEEGYAPDIRGQLRKEYEKRKMSRGNPSTSYALRFFMILIMLFIAAFYLFIKNSEGIMGLFGL